jgi:hypothetical protein
MHVVSVEMMKAGALILYTIRYCLFRVGDCKVLVENGRTRGSSLFPAMAHITAWFQVEQNTLSVFLASISVEDDDDSGDMKEVDHVCFGDLIKALQLSAFFSMPRSSTYLHHVCSRTKSLCSPVISSSCSEE